MATARAELSAVDWVVRTNMLLPGLYAWTSTVAVPAFARGVGPAARVTAIGAVLFMLAGPFVAIVRPRLGRALGIHAFLAMCLVTWILVGDGIAVERLEVVRAALGALGWMLFAFGWGVTRPLGYVPEEDPRVLAGVPLNARGRLPAGAYPVFVVGLVGALAPPAVAWRVARADHALFAHAVAIVCAISVLIAASRVAVDRGKWEAPRSASRFNAAAGSLMLLGVVLAVGFLWMVLG